MMIEQIASLTGGGTSTLLGSALLVVAIMLSVHLWQRKEYRWDRMKSFLTTPEHLPFRSTWLSLFYALVGAAWIMYLLRFDTVAQLIGFIALIALGIRYGLLYRRAGLFRPHFTLKSALAVSFSVVIAIGLVRSIVLPLDLLALRFATALALLPLGIAGAVVLTNAVAYIRKRIIIARAKALRKSTPNVKVVAITGSVGKTSTKEYIAHILRASGRKTIATHEHRNSEFAVAQDMLEQLRTDAEFYVVEAAAYRKGEISAITDLVQPQVGVITVIQNQHEGLFGSLEALAQAKWEIVERLPKDGVAVLNADDKVISHRAKNLSLKTVLFSAHGQQAVFVEDISAQTDHITCRLHVGDAVQSVKIPVVGRGALVNAIAAVAAAYAVGVSSDDIFRAVGSLPHIPRTMEIRMTQHGITVLDDSYSASEASVRDAIEHLALFPQSDKRIVLVPVIELATSGPKVHEGIGELLAQSKADVYIFGRAYEADIQRGAGSVNTIKWFDDAQQLVKALQSETTSNTVVLLEGRVPSIVRQVFI